MLKRLFNRSAKASASRPPVIQRQRQDASRWAAVLPSQAPRLQVLDKQAEGQDAVRLVLQPLDAAVDGRLLEYRAGQHLSCVFDIAGERLHRPYSICRGEGAQQIELCCKRVADGRVSNYICDQLEVGDIIEVQGPAGRFGLASESRPMFCLAAGSGVTPIMSLIETALAAQPQREICLVLANRNQHSMVLKRQLEDLSARHDSLRVIHVLSQPEAGWEGERGRLDAQRLLALYQPAADSEVYLCGPQALMDLAEDALIEAGVAADAIHREVFTAAARAGGDHPQQPQTLRFRASGREVVQQPGQSILDAALAAGIAVDFSCTVGGCAACKLRLAEGHAVMDEPNCLSAAERAEGYVLACSAYATEDVVIEA